MGRFYLLKFLDNSQAMAANNGKFNDAPYGYGDNTQKYNKKILAFSFGNVLYYVDICFFDN